MWQKENARKLRFEGCSLLEPGVKPESTMGGTIVHKFRKDCQVLQSALAYGCGPLFLPHSPFICSRFQLQVRQIQIVLNVILRSCLHTLVTFSQGLKCASCRPEIIMAFICRIWMNKWSFLSPAQPYSLSILGDNDYCKLFMYIPTVLSELKSDLFRSHLRLIQQYWAISLLCFQTFNVSVVLAAWK